MRPGQLEPNEFERAILERLAGTSKELEGLHVLSREYTGVGSFTRFQCEEGRRKVLGLDALIRVPSVPNGMGAVLFCKADSPECLEIFTYGDDHWDGVYDGFVIEETA